jgi:uncharacterized membrane protein (UPF0127 family)
MKQGIICIGSNLFETLLAVSQEEQARGLMHRSPPVPNMTFVYAYPSINRFWMANTPAPLDIIFCHQGKVAQICYGEPFSTRALGDHMSDLVVEFPHGTAFASDIKIGQSALLVAPTQAQVLKIIAETNGYPLRSY